MGTQAVIVDKPLSKWLVVIALLLAVCCAAAALLSGVGYRLDWWHFRTGFSIIKWAFQLAIPAVALAVIGLALSSRKPNLNMTMAVLAIIIGGVVIYFPWSWKQALDSLPHIHDITTDMENPPAFVVVGSIRDEGDHPVEYDGPAVAEQQRAAYPDIQSLVVSADEVTVYEEALQLVESMGWEIVDSSGVDLRIEATDTTLLYGFKDDIVLQFTRMPGGTQIDMRSKSRVGRSDLGMNARRIRKFLAKLKTELG